MIDLKKDLQLQIDDAFHMLNEMSNAAKAFYSDIANKNDAMHIDIDAYNMNEKSSGVGYKPFYDRLPENNNQRLHAAILKGGDLLHKLHNGLHMAMNRMANQADQVNGVLRMRIHDTLRALREVEYQLKAVSTIRYYYYSYIFYFLIYYHYFLASDFTLFFEVLVYLVTTEDKGEATDRFIIKINTYLYIFHIHYYSL
ncbi:unnamed protein product [Trichobilharzia regenti]|nr:unnamed protein product [Trichobilharzia regenti]